MRRSLAIGGVVLAALVGACAGENEMVICKLDVYHNGVLYSTDTLQAEEGGTCLASLYEGDSVGPIPGYVDLDSVGPIPGDAAMKMARPEATSRTARAAAAGPGRWYKTVDSVRHGVRAAP